MDTEGPDSTPPPPGGRFRQGVVWNVASLVVLGVSGIVVNSLIAHYRGAAALGVFNQAYSVYILFSQLAVGGVHLSVLRGVSYHHRDRRTAAEIATAGVVLASLLALPACLLLAFGRELFGRLVESPAVARAIACTVPGLFLFSVNKVLLSVLNGLRHMRAFAVFQALRFLLILSWVGVAIAMRLDTAALAGALSVAEGALFVAVALYVRLRVFPPAFGPRLRRHIGEHLSFGVRGCLSGALLEINTRVDVLMLGYFLDDRAVGVYSFAAVFAEGFAQIVVVLRRNIDPILGEHFARREPERISRDARRLERATWLAMGGLGAVAVLGYPLVLQALSESAGLGESWGLFAILVAGTALASGYKIFQGILLQGGRPGLYTGFVACVLGGNVILNAALIPHLGVHGAALATSTVAVAEAAGLAVVARRVLGVRL